jgi:hypothetical protein
MQKNKEQKAKEFWDRINSLIQGENPYSWAVGHGINRSTFQSAYTRGSRPLDKTIDEWAELIGVDANWLKTGHGNPFCLPSAEEVINETIMMRQAFKPTHLADALEILDSVLKSTGKTMDYESQAEMIIKLCYFLDNSEDMSPKQTMSTILTMLDQVQAS